MSRSSDSKPTSPCCRGGLSRPLRRGRRSSTPGPGLQEAGPRRSPSRVLGERSRPPKGERGQRKEWRAPQRTGQRGAVRHLHPRLRWRHRDHRLAAYSRGGQLRKDQQQQKPGHDQRGRSPGPQLPPSECGLQRRSPTAPAGGGGCWGKPVLWQSGGKPRRRTEVAGRDHARPTCGLARRVRQARLRAVRRVQTGGRAPATPRRKRESHSRGVHRGHTSRRSRLRRN